MPVVLYFVLLVISKYQPVFEIKIRHCPLQPAQLTCFVVTVQFEAHLHSRRRVVMPAKHKIALFPLLIEIKYLIPLPFQCQIHHILQFNVSSI